MDGHGWLGCGQEAEVTRIAGEYLPTAPGDRLCRDHGIDGVGSARSAQERSSHSTDLGMCRLDPPDVVQHTMNARIRTATAEGLGEDDHRDDDVGIELDRTSKERHRSRF
jgi:hypothetical protein